MSLLAELERFIAPVIDFADTRSVIERLPTRKPLSLTHGILGRERGFIGTATALANRPKAGLDLNAVRRDRVYLKDYDDRRLWHPLGQFRPAVGVPRGATQLVDKPDFERLRRFEERILRPGPFSWPMGKYWSQAMPTRVMFKTPLKVVICAKRYLRRRAMFASGYAGLGYSPNWFGKKHYTEFSFVGC